MDVMVAETAFELLGTDLARSADQDGPAQPSAAFPLTVGSAGARDSRDSDEIPSRRTRCNLRNAWGRRRSSPT